MKKLVITTFLISLAFNAQSEEGEAVYKQYCSACHDLGGFGAPRIGDSRDWAPRISKGIVVLNYNAVMGFAGQKGVMPPKGGHLNLDDSKVESAVQYMIDRSW